MSLLRRTEERRRIYPAQWQVPRDYVGYVVYVCTHFSASIHFQATGCYFIPTPRRPKSPEKEFRLAQQTRLPDVNQSVYRPNLQR